MPTLFLPCLAVLIILAPIAAWSGRTVLVRWLLLAAALLAAAGLALPDQTWAWSLSWADRADAISFGLRGDGLGLTMSAFIAGIGVVVHRYADRYLLGDPRRMRFLAVVTLVVALAQWQALSPGLVQFACGWIAVSFCLHSLLGHERDNPRARSVVATKFIVSRIGDSAMLIAIAALLAGPGTTDFAALMRMDASGHGVALSIAAIAVVLAVACKTALVPFQHWLIGTIEAPTPVSALMHAGVVNAGGVLLILLSPLFAAATVGLDLLLLVGLVSALMGPAAMWAQADFKRSLAWSTVGQMGFMAVQCGLGAYGAAFLHLLGHGCYKADAFLRSGTLGRALEVRPAAEPLAGALLRWITGVIVAAGVLAGTYALLGISIAQLHGGATLLAVQALAMGQLAATPTAGGCPAVVRFALLAVASVCYAVFACAAEWIIAHAVVAAPAPADRSVAGLVLAIAVPIGLAGLAALWIALPTIARWPTVARWRVHAASGFYLPQITERLVRRLRPAGRLQPGASHE